MCGRFAFYSPHEAVQDIFGVVFTAPLEPRYNVAPSQFIVTLRNGGEALEPALLKWGLVPSWAKDPAIGHRMINARAETVAEKPAYRAAYRHRRCVVLADGFYEWSREGDTKTPFFISRASGGPFALAGLWENWDDKESGESLQTTTLITTGANDFMTPLHHRMPVILESNTAGEWLAGSNDLLDDVATITPELQAWPVDRRVNNARNEGDDLICAAGEVLR